jgi:hypothetical protein
MKKVLCLIPVAFLAACAAPMPSGPSVMVLPGSGKSFDSFRFDDYECRQFSSTQLNGATPEQASENAAGRSAALGAVVGGLAGAALGGNSRGLVAGAALGTAGGAVAGAGAGQASGRSLQQRYDVSYQQCMYAKGHQIPVAGRYSPRTAPSAPPPPPPSAGTPPPPPAGTPPPPPPKG